MAVEQLLVQWLFAKARRHANQRTSSLCGDAAPEAIHAQLFFKRTHLQLRIKIL